MFYIFSVNLTKAKEHNNSASSSLMWPHAAAVSCVVTAQNASHLLWLRLVKFQQHCWSKDKFFWRCQLHPNVSSGHLQKKTKTKNKSALKIKTWRQNRASQHICTDVFGQIFVSCCVTLPQKSRQTCLAEKKSTKVGGGCGAPPLPPSPSPLTRSPLGMIARNRAAENKQKVARVSHVTQMSANPQQEWSQCWQELICVWHSVSPTGPCVNQTWWCLAAD